MSEAAPERICLSLQIDPALRDASVARRSPMRPGMRAELTASDRRNHSLFLGAKGRPGQTATPLTQSFALHDQLRAAGSVARENEGTA